MAKLEGFTAIFAIFVVSAISIQHASGELVCESLSEDICAFAISSAGKRCVLEKYSKGAGERYQCRTSQVKVDGMAEYIETDECIQACGVKRSWIGISSDSLLDLRFLDKLCSVPCFNMCHNIVDLYFNLAAAEGIYLPTMCESLAQGVRRGMIEGVLTNFISSAQDAAAPTSMSSPLF